MIIRARLGLIGGNLYIHSRAGAGTSVMIALPWNDTNEGSGIVAVTRSLSRTIISYSERDCRSLLESRGLRGNRRG